MTTVTEKSNHGLATSLSDALRSARAQLDTLNEVSHHSDSVEALRAVADMLPQLVWLTRPDGFVEYFNRRWWEYTGLTYEQSKGSAWSIILHPDDYQLTLNRWNTALETGNTYEVEYRLRHGATGEYRWFLGRGVPSRDLQGNIVRWFGTCTDIHDQKLAQEALQLAKSQIESTSRAKDEFLATLSHELRTPLSAILGWVQLMEMGVLDPTEQKEAIRTIKEQAKAQSQLIEDLLEVSRIISGKFHMRDETVDWSAVVRSVVDALTPAMLDKQIVPKCEVTPDLHVRGDAQRLQQVIWNLLANAIKFTPNSGTIEVRLTRKEDQAELSVSDNGKGIPSELLGCIFERFHQADTGSSRAHGGMGLGLSIVQHIVTHHRGTVAAHSDGENRGSTFTVTLPEHKARGDSVSTEVPKFTDHHALAGKRVLIVDDEECARTVVATCLRKFGAEVQTAVCVPDALTIIRKGDIDLLISDLAMPIQDGFDLIRTIRAEGTRSKHLPCIALTAFASVDDQINALQAGFDVHASKPVDSLDLINRVVHLIGRGLAVAS